MSTKKITSLTELSAAPAATDMAAMVDVSDTTDAASGTTKKITATNFCKGVGIGAGTTSSEPVNIDTSNGRLGVGTGSPSVPLHVEQSSGAAGLFKNTGASVTYLRGDAVQTSADAALFNLSCFWDGTSVSQISFMSGADTSNKDDGYMGFYVGEGGTTRQAMKLTQEGNIHLLNTTSAPSSTGANSIALYAEDVSTSELRVRDEAGNITTLSPHNFDLLGERSDPMAWSYYAKNVFVGKELSVDMMKVIRALEKLTGEEYITIRDLPSDQKLDWATEEKKKEDESKLEIAQKKKEGGTPPTKYTKKSKPSWIS